MSKKYQDNINFWEEVKELRDALRETNVLDRLTALEEKYERLLNMIAELSDKSESKIEALESVLGTLLKTLESQILMQKQGFDFDIDIYEQKVKDLIKQLEGK